VNYEGNPLSSSGRSRLSADSGSRIAGAAAGARRIAGARRAGARRAAAGRDFFEAVRFFALLALAFRFGAAFLRRGAAFRFVLDADILPLLRPLLLPVFRFLAMDAPSP
jgi:hypothetical protein